VQNHYFPISQKLVIFHLQKKMSSIYQQIRHLPFPTKLVVFHLQKKSSTSIFQKMKSSFVNKLNLGCLPFSKQLRLSSIKKKCPSLSTLNHVKTNLATVKCLPPRDFVCLPEYFFTSSVTLPSNTEQNIRRAQQYNHLPCPY
jgi:hypothetical protein